MWHSLLANVQVCNYMQLQNEHLQTLCNSYILGSGGVCGWTTGKKWDLNNTILTNALNILMPYIIIPFWGVNTEVLYPTNTQSTFLSFTPAIHLIQYLYNRTSNHRERSSHLQVIFPSTFMHTSQTGHFYNSSVTVWMKIHYLYYQTILHTTAICTVEN